MTKTTYLDALPAAGTTHHLYGASEVTVGDDWRSRVVPAHLEVAGLEPAPFALGTVLTGGVLTGWERLEDGTVLAELDTGDRVRPDGLKVAELEWRAVTDLRVGDVFVYPEGQLRLVLVGPMLAVEVQRAGAVVDEYEGLGAVRLEPGEVVQVLVR